ncbi:putative alcohol O-acetyltransferase [Rosa chinensis]|uniref:Putative alcohol O-acetyltransferase n=1 Tax=Rosa chinensis TaxID=74649 RepID=A0A2P6PR79_ROSCH|nr:putative alcohol O-acetyltransferase [Rosa chinensis]
MSLFVSLSSSTLHSPSFSSSSSSPRDKKNEMHRMVDWWGLCAALASSSPYLVLLNDLLLIPIWHYVLAFLTISFAFLYYFLEFHFLHDLFTGFRGCPVTLTYHSSSHIYHDVVSKCRILHSRYLVTPWLSSPHVQTAFLSIFGRPPLFNYRRQLFHLSDGGTIALDWLLNSDVLGNNFDITTAIPKDDINPIVLAIPGLTSDSESASIKHLAFNTAQKGWNVVVINHRGLGGVPITSDCFYDAGWTEDLRAVINHLHHEYPNAPLFVVGMSMGANILVKYLGEDGDSIPVAGAVAICSPWDLLISDRFLHRRLLQKIYGRVLAIGLQDYVQLYSRSIRDFDHHAIRLLGKFETVDTYYRHCMEIILCTDGVSDPTLIK